MMSLCFLHGGFNGPVRLSLSHMLLDGAGVDGFTIGSALFEGNFASGHGDFAAQVRAVLDCLPPRA